MGSLSRGSQAHLECSNRFPLFVQFGWVLGPFWAKKGLFWSTKCAVWAGYLPTWCHLPRAPSVSVWLKTWIWQGHHLGSTMARVKRSKAK